MKRYVTKWIGFLLVIAMLIGLLPATVFAAEPEPIDSISATITLPTAGAYPVETGTAGDSSYTVRSVHFYDDEDNKLGSSDTFEAGATYQIIVKFRPASGYEIKSTANVTINGLPATYWSSIADGWGSINFYIEYTVPQPEHIDSVSATITLPTAGAHPVTTGTPGDSLYSISLVDFYDSGFQELDLSDTFQAGETYRIFVRFRPNSGYTIERTTTATINGMNAAYWNSVATEAGQLFIFYIEYTVPQPEPIASVSATITLPTAGAHPVDTGTPGDSLYTIAWVNFYDSDSHKLDASDTFQAGETYSVYVAFLPNSAYTIDETTTATINGINAKYHTSIGSGANRKFIFRIDKYTVPKPIPELNVRGIAAPFAGETANTSGITVNNGQGITVATAQWCILKDRLLQPMSATAKFTGGMTYYLVIQYALAEGYTVSDSAVVLHDLPGGEAGHSATGKTITLAYKVPYKITVTTDGGGTASASHTAAAEGTTVTLTATPKPGYEFVKWSVTTPRGLRILGNSFTMPAGNVTIQAVFAATGGVPGDMDGDGDADTDDAVYLLLHVMFGEADYPIANPDKDLNNDDKVDTDDAVYLLLHVMFGAEDYPI